MLTNNRIFLLQNYYAILTTVAVIAIIIQNRTRNVANITEP